MKSKRPAKGQMHAIPQPPARERRMPNFISEPDSERVRRSRSAGRRPTENAKAVVATTSVTHLPSQGRRAPNITRSPAHVRARRPNTTSRRRPNTVATTAVHSPSSKRGRPATFRATNRQAPPAQALRRPGANSIEAPAAISSLADSRARLAFHGRMYSQLVRAQVKLGQQIRAIERSLGAQRRTKVERAPVLRQSGTGKRGERGQNPPVLRTRPAALASLASAPLVEAREIILKNQRVTAREISAIVEQLPVWPWWEGIRGCGALGLGLIVGEAGEVLDTKNPAKLWKRFGLGLVGGRAQGKVAGNPKLAIRMGYSPRRRTIMHQVGEALMKQNGKGEYRALYLARKKLETRKLIAAKLAEGKKRVSEASVKAHAHKRALRYMEKRLLRNLWRAWRDVRKGQRVAEAAA